MAVSLYAKAAEKGSFSPLPLRDELCLDMHWRKIIWRCATAPVSSFYCVYTNSRETTCNGDREG